MSANTPLFLPLAALILAGAATGFAASRPVLIDDFENADRISRWESQPDSTLSLILSDPSNVHSGKQALRWTYSKTISSGAWGNEVHYTLPTPQDWSAYDALSIQIKAGAAYAGQSIRVKLLNDGQSVSGKETFAQITARTSGFAQTRVPLASATARDRVTGLIFYVNGSEFGPAPASCDFYIDDLALETNSPDTAGSASAIDRFLSETPTVPDSFGINIHFFNNDAGWKALASTGSKWVRQDFFWDRVEKQKGVYDFTETDALVNAVTGRDLKLLGILCYSNPFYEKQRNITTEEGRRAFVRYAEALVTRYRGKPIVWEIWNEPNNGGFWVGNDPKLYTQLVKETAAALRKADPDVVLLGPSVYQFDFPYIEACLKEGLLDHLDAISIHPYLRRHPELLVPRMAELRALLEKYTPAGRKPLPIVCSEWGFSTTDQGVEGGAARVARSLFLGIMEKMPIHIYYTLWNGGTNPANAEQNYGLFTRHPWLLPRPGAVSFTTATRVLDGFSFGRRIPVEEHPELFLLEFRKGDETRLVHWVGAEDDSKTIEWRLPDSLGARSRIAQEGQALSGILLPGDTVRSTYRVEYLLPETSMPAWKVDARLLPDSRVDNEDATRWSFDLLNGPSPANAASHETGVRDIATGAIDVWVRPDREDFGKDIVVGGDLKEAYPTLKISIDESGHVVANHYSWHGGRGWRTPLRGGQPVQPGQWLRITYQWGDPSGRRLYTDGFPTAAEPAETRGLAFAMGVRVEPLAGKTGLVQLITGPGYHP